MSRGLGKVEREVLGLCIECLNLKKQMIETGKPDLVTYDGGERYYLKREKYWRLIRIGRDGERYFDVPEDVIDLREISHMFRYEKKDRDWMDWTPITAYHRAVNSLKRKGYFLILSRFRIEHGCYQGISFEQYQVEKHSPFDFYEKHMRFVKLNTDKLKCSECNQNV